ncbi:uncharacterized protein LOC123981143 [Micropterus dolomieu]|uniref:uncharacterized protein LOC123981143 n=1 Tax=Micropterus dolomieu TaxID=147949 RepID=UPI001E8D6B98|nr:uncharacterized protein LOC123981143 [Micropterus dolomieu]
MGEQVGVWLRAAVLAALLISVLAEDKYFAAGGKLELRPQPSAAITNILWKHNGNLLAEWVQGKIELTYYGSFNGRTTLNTTTGRLEIKNMVEADAGQYVVEINSHVQSPSYDVKMIKEVTKPEVVLRPVSCNEDSEECTLSCDGDIAGAKPVTYSWKEGAGDWKESGKDMKITKTNTGVKTFSCKMENPVSEKESEPLDNPFYIAAAESSSAGTIAFSVIFPLIVIIAIAVVFVLIKKGVIPKFWSANDREQVPTVIPSGNGDAASNVKNSPDAL